MKPTGVKFATPIRKDSGETPVEAETALAGGAIGAELPVAIGALAVGAALLAALAAASCWSCAASSCVTSPFFTSKLRSAWEVSVWARAVPPGAGRR